MNCYVLQDLDHGKIAGNLDGVIISKDIVWNKTLIKVKLQWGQNWVSDLHIKLCLLCSDFSQSSSWSSSATREDIQQAMLVLVSPEQLYEER